MTAVLNAHQKNAGGREALNELQSDVEGAVATRSDLDTPAGARDFQRYLIGKLRDIRAVVAGASLDDTSNSALMAAWTSLYNAAQYGPEAADNQQRPTVQSGDTPAQRVAKNEPAATESDLKPYLDALQDDDHGPPSEDMPMQSAPAPARRPRVRRTFPRLPVEGFRVVRRCPAWACRGDFRCPGRCRAATNCRRGLPATHCQKPTTRRTIRRPRRTVTIGTPMRTLNRRWLTLPARRP